jgi:hypothetical protein
MDDTTPQIDGTWPGITGKSHAVFQNGLDLWIAHDAGLFHMVPRVVDPDVPMQLREERWDMDLVLWHDVRDVEASSRLTTGPKGRLPRKEWSILIQYPRIKATRDEDEFRDFVIAVARLAAANH